jgi:glutathione reductase (NADPH)
VVTHTVLTRVDKTDAGLTAHLANGQSVHTNALMLAVGRDPYSEGLGCEAAGVECQANGAIKVDAYSQTSVPSIYAVGDVTNRMNLTPVAIREGACLAAHPCRLTMI